MLLSSSRKEGRCIYCRFNIFRKAILEDKLCSNLENHTLYQYLLWFCTLHSTTPQWVVMVKSVNSTRCPIKIKIVCHGNQQSNKHIRMRRLIRESISASTRERGSYNNVTAMTHHPRGWYFGQWCDTSCFLCTSWLLQQRFIFSLSAWPNTSCHFGFVRGKNVEVKNPLHRRERHK